MVDGSIEVQAEAELVNSSKVEDKIADDSAEELEDYCFVDSILQEEKCLDHFATGYMLIKCNDINMNVCVTLLNFDYIKYKPFDMCLVCHSHFISLQRKRS